eukprot:Gb_31717 [translate_table: standard]
MAVKSFWVTEGNDDHLSHYAQEWQQFSAVNENGQHNLGYLALQQAKVIVLVDGESITKIIGFLMEGTTIDLKEEAKKPKKEWVIQKLYPGCVEEVRKSENKDKTTMAYLGNFYATLHGSVMDQKESRKSLNTLKTNGGNSNGKGEHSKEEGQSGPERAELLDEKIALLMDEVSKLDVLPSEEQSTLATEVSADIRPHWRLAHSSHDNSGPPPLMYPPPLEPGTRKSPLIVTILVATENCEEPTLVREDWVGPTYGVPVVMPIAAPGSQVGICQKGQEANINSYPVPLAGKL